MVSRSITWKGFEHESLENCVIHVSQYSFQITSFIIGKFEKLPFKIEYKIEVSPQWETRSFEIVTTLKNSFSKITYTSDKDRNWFVDGKIDTRLAGCFDIDISATPFTNTLAINRLNLIPGQPRLIEVVYVDIFEKSIRVEKQRYEKLTDSQIKFTQISNGFEAIVSVDDLGFVTSYPELFEQISAY